MNIKATDYVMTLNVGMPTQTVYVSPDLLACLRFGNAQMGASRRAGMPILDGTVHRGGVLMYVLRNQHWVKP